MFDLLGDVGHVHLREELGAVILVEFHEHIGLHLFVKKFEKIFGFFEVEILIEFGNVGRVEIGEFLAGRGVGAVMDYFAEMFEIFGVNSFMVRGFWSGACGVRLPLVCSFGAPCQRVIQS